MKAKLLFIIIFLMPKMFAFVESDSLNWQIDLNGDKTIQHIKLYFEENQFVLKVDTNKIGLNSTTIQSVVDEHNKDHVIIFDDINDDGRLEIIINTEHPLFYNKSILRVFSYSNNQFKQLDFLDVENNIYKEIISLDKTVLYNFSTKNLYCKTNQIFFNSKNGETIFFDKIVLFKWDKKTEYLTKKGEKYFEKLRKNKLSKIVF